MTAAQATNFYLHPRQSQAFQSPATELLYGGSAGGGKSHFMRVAAIMWCCLIPGLQVYLFRRISDDLVKNHVEGPTGFNALLATLVNSGHVKIVEGEIRFWNNSRIFLCHCKDEDHRFKYQGPEIHVLIVDELTHFTDIIYRYLRGRVRMPEDFKSKIPAAYRDLFPRIVCSSNPGGIGHQFVKSTWIDPKPAMEVWQTPDDEGGFIRQFIPAKLSDNPSLNQITYTRTLKGLGNEALVKAMLEGDWDIVAGAALSISRDRHMVRPFTPPAHWVKFQVMDWGYVKPYAVGWFAVSDGAWLAAKDDWPELYLPSGSVVMYRELYGTTGKPDEGSREESEIVVKNLMKIEEEANETIDYRVADTAMWAKNDGMSTFERMYKASKKKFNPRQSIKDRQAAYSEFNSRLRGEEVGPDEFVPMFYATANCQHFWRTVPPLVLDDIKPESGPDTSQEDHAYDMTCYALMSRPYIKTEDQRIREEFNRKRLQFKVDGHNDPYRLRSKGKK